MSGKKHEWNYVNPLCNNNNNNGNGNMNQRVLQELAV